MGGVCVGCVWQVPLVTNMMRDVAATHAKRQGLPNCQPGDVNSLDPSLKLVRRQSA